MPKRLEKMKVLLIEDDRQLIEFVKKGLVQAGFTVETALDGATGLQLALEGDVDVAVIDIMLPVMDGFEVIERLRAQRPGLPILVLSAKRSIEDKVKGLELGSDDYITKPFSFSELLARIRAILRRTQGLGEELVLRAGPISLNIISRKVEVNHREVELGPKEFVLLEYLMQNKGRVLTRIQILEKIWGYRFDPESNVVDVYICKLREKLGLHSKDGIIRTIRGAGYMIRDED